jgi:hypothetical protein
MAHPNPADVATRLFLEAAAPTEAELQQHQREIEMQKERARIRELEARARALEQAIRTAAKVLTPYLSSTGR